MKGENFPTRYLDIIEQDKGEKVSIEKITRAFSNKVYEFCYVKNRKSKKY